jgi:hypothetical protein
MVIPLPPFIFPLCIRSVSLFLLRDFVCHGSGLRMIGRWVVDHMAFDCLRYIYIEHSFLNERREIPGWIAFVGWRGVEGGPEVGLEVGLLCSGMSETAR